MSDMVFLISFYGFLLLVCRGTIDFYILILYVAKLLYLFWWICVCVCVCVYVWIPWDFLWSCRIILSVNKCSCTSFTIWMSFMYVLSLIVLEHWISPSFYTLFVSFIESESSVFPKTEYFCVLVQHMHSFPGGSVIKHLTANAGNTDSIPGSGRSPGEGNGNTSSSQVAKVSDTTYN